MKLSRWQQLQYTVLFVGIALTARNAHALTFAPLVNYPAPSQLSGMAAGDLDGDGNLDFVSANGASNSFTVFMGQGDGTFRSVTTYSLSSTPLYVALGDFNGDHKLDLAITCYGSNDVKVLLGNGDGTFGAATSLSAGNNPRGIMVGDFNHDNQLDLAITNIMDNTVEVFLGNGDGTFQTGQVTAVGATQPGALAAADLNGDGKLDLVTSNYFGANCSVLLGNGDGTFAPAVTYAADSNPSSIAVQDLNNDGVPDIVVSNHAGNVSVLLGNGDGTFKPQVKYAVGANPLRVVFDDFNHDGTLDMAVALYDDAKVALLYGNGDGTFGTPIKFSVGAGSGELFVADLNHDGLDDLIIGQQNVPAVGVLLQTLNVTGLSFTPNAIIAPPTQLVATLSSNLNPASVTTSTVRLVRAGPDGVLGTADDVAITCNGVSVNGNQVTLDLTGATLPNDKYRFTLASPRSLPTANLGAYWKFDEGSGTTTADSSGNGNTGTLTGGVQWTPKAVAGSALGFDGIDAAVHVPASTSLEPENGITVAMWGFISNSVNGNVADLLRKENGPGYALRWDLDDGHLGWYIVGTGGQTWLARDPQPNANYINKWHHYAATYDAPSGILKLYVDGVLHATTSGGPSTLLHSDDLYLMFVNYGAQVAVAGILDEVRVFDRALSGTEIEGLVATHPGLSGTGGALLDGAFSGAFPSGDGTYTDFKADFSIQTPTIWVTNMSPAPGTTLSSVPTSIVTTFNKPVDPASVNSNTVRLVRAGPDGQFGTADDVAVTPSAISVAGDGLSATVDLTGVKQPDDRYQLTLSSGQAVPGGLVGNWNFSEGAGTVAHDSSGLGNDGALGGAPVWTTGPTGGALHFDGVHDIVTVNRSTSLEPSSGITVSAWGNITDTRSGTNAELIRKDGSFAQGYLLRWSRADGHLQFVITRNGMSDTIALDNQSNASYLNAWHHFVGTYDASSGVAKLYVDGVLHSTAQGTPGNLQHTDNLYFMQFVEAGNSPTPGTLGNVRIYDHALSAAEVQALFCGSITDANGNSLDGRFTGAFPSGDGTFANFNATFTLTTPKLTLTSLTPAPGAALNAPPTSIVATFSKPVDPASVNASTVQLVRAGPDGQFGTADDVLITPHALTVANDGLSATVDLTGTKLRDDQYQLTLRSLEAGLSPGLIGRWTFNEGSGTVAHDTSGNGNDGTLSSPSWTAGVYGAGLNFNGVNDIVTVNQAASLEPLNGLTVAAWANIPNYCAGKICELVRKDGPFQYGYILRWSDNNNSGLVELIITRNGIPTIHCTDTQGNAAYLNTWHHFAGSYDAASGTAKLYVDGVLKNTVTGTAGPLQHTDNLYFMNYPYTGSSATPGKLDEVRIYNRALNVTEVQQLAATTQGVVDANGNPLDGKFTGTFPSGDGTFADFNAGFTVSTPKLTVTGMTPAPNSLIVGAPASITAIFSKPLDPSSVNTNTVKIVRAGSDGLFGTADDVAVTPNSITAATDGLSATADLTGLNLPGDRYQLRISSGNGPVNSGLTAWWKLDETSGTSVSDSSGLNQTGLWHGSSLAWTAGRVGGALQFISGDSYVEAPDNAAAIGTSDFSVAFWVNFTDGNLVHLISNRKSTVHANFWEITANGGSGIFEVDQDTVGTNYNRTATTVPLNNGVWHHFAAVRQGPQCWVYVDGVLNATATGPGIANITNASPIELGNTPYIGLNGSQTFHGKLDEVRIFSRALSASEIQQLAGVPGVTDSNGNPLDGKFTGTFPSGDGSFADFVANFRVDTAPVANAQALSVHSNAALPLTLTATDADNDPLTFTLTSSPAHGQLVGTPPNLTYLPGAFAGADNFSFKVNDGIADSNIATVVLNVADAAPVALAGAAIVHSGASTPVVLSAVDADGDPINYSLVSLPAHGTLTGTLPNLMYTAGAFTGTDSFSFKANDGVLDSNVATFTITVANNPPTVTAAASPTTLLEFQQVSFTSTSSDPDGDALTVSWDFGDGATSSDANPVHAYTAAGTYTATVTVTDVGGLTAQATVMINVYQQADLPVARFVTSDLTGFVGQPVGFDATFSTDPDNNLVAYDWDFGDSSRHGAGQLISRVYTAPGTYTVTLTVINGFGLSDTTSLTVVVLPASEAGLFPSTLSYSVSWNRATRNADRMKLDALVNVGELPVTSATPLTLGIVGQSFSGTTGTNGPSRSGPTVQWKVKPGKKGSPKGTLQISATISHISVGAAFAKAGAVGATLKTLHLPVMLSVGGESFQASISSQFRFGNNGMRATGGGSGPK